MASVVTGSTSKGTHVCFRSTVVGPCLLRSTLLERGETQWPLINTQTEKENVLRIREEPKMLRMVVTRTHGAVPPGPPNQLQGEGGRLSRLPLVCQCLMSYNDYLLNSYPGGGRKTVLTFRPQKKHKHIQINKEQREGENLTRDQNHSKTQQRVH